jgi:RNA polymerase sigma factor (sigma-70 family)
MSGDARNTRWTVILGAAAGQPLAREEFARRYEGVIRAYLGARWRGTPFVPEIDDATQDVFVECFKENGALARVDPGHRGGFRTFLFAVVRNVARRFEERRALRRERQAPSDLDVPGADETASRAFDRAWARTIMGEATRLMTERARAGGTAAERRVELLRLRFADGRPPREIAEAWGLKPAQVQYEYKRARDEFQAALLDVVRRHDPAGDPAAECVRLLALLG